MSNRDAVTQLMREVGPLADLLLVEQSAAGDFWRLIVDETTEVTAELDEAAEVLEFATILGRPAEADQLRIFSLLLQFNRHYGDTGVVLALDTPTGQVLQLHRRPLRAIDLTALAALIRALAERHVALRGLVTASAPPREDALSASMDEFTIRV